MTGGGSAASLRRVRASSARVRALLVGLLAVTVAASASALAAPAAQAVTRTGGYVAGYCSSPSGFVHNAFGPVETLRLTVTPSRPRAGSKIKAKVFVKQAQQTPPGSVYPRRILQGQVVVKVGAKSHVLKGPVNDSTVSGSILPNGWSAKGSFKAPAKGKRTASVTRIVYNARGAFNGGWGSSYAGFDLVCSGGANPLLTATPYAVPKLTLKVRRAL